MDIYEYLAPDNLLQFFKLFKKPIDASECAYAIWRSRNRSIFDKIKAYKWVIKNCEDMSFPATDKLNEITSFHAVLRENIVMQRNELKSFFTPSEGAIYIVTMRNAYTEDWIKQYFTTAKSAIQAVKRIIETESIEDPDSFCEYYVNKITQTQCLQTGWLNSCGKLKFVTFDGNEALEYSLCPSYRPFNFLDDIPLNPELIIE